MRSVLLGLVAVVLLVSAPAQAAPIYLNCQAKDPDYNPVARTWVVSTDAGTVDPIGGSFVVSYRKARISPTRIEGTERTEAGNLLVFDLDRVSGRLTFTFINRAVPAAEGIAKFELDCRAVAKPAV